MPLGYEQLNNPDEPEDEATSDENESEAAEPESPVGDESETE